MKNRKLRKSRTDRRGVTTVEMALILPIFLALIFGCLEFSRISMIRSQSANAAYEAARNAMVLGGVNTDATAVANEQLGFLGVSQATTVVMFTDEDGTEVLPGLAKLVRVRVSVPYKDNSFFGAFLPTGGADSKKVSLANAVIASEVTLRTNAR